MSLISWKITFSSIVVSGPFVQVDASGMRYISSDMQASFFVFLFKFLFQNLFKQCFDHILSSPLTLLKLYPPNYPPNFICLSLSTPPQERQRQQQIPPKQNLPKIKISNYKKEKKINKSKILKQKVHTHTHTLTLTNHDTQFNLANYSWVQSLVEIPSTTQSEKTSFPFPVDINCK